MSSRKNECVGALRERFCELNNKIETVRRKYQRTHTHPQLFSSNNQAIRYSFADVGISILKRFAPSRRPSAINFFQMRTARLIKTPRLITNQIITSAIFADKQDNIGGERPKVTFKSVSEHYNY